MTIKAWLQGRPGDLEALARHFSIGDHHVARDGDGGDYYMTSPSFNELWNDGGTLRDVASTLLTQMNGVARVLHPGFQPAELASRYSDATGSQHVVALAGIACASVVATAVLSINGVVQEPLPSRAPLYLQQATHPDVAEVFEILGKADDLGWIDLYKIFEVVRDNVGNQKTLIAKGWKSREDISAFTISANSPTVSGDAARHARLNDGTPQRTMTLAEGRAFIDELVRAWLDDLSRPNS